MKSEKIIRVVELFAGVVVAALFLISSAAAQNNDLSLNTALLERLDDGFSSGEQKLILDLFLRQYDLRAVDDYINPDDYIVGPGDHFSIRFLSDEIKDFGCRIESDGTIYIKSVGSLEVRHITLTEAMDKIAGAIGQFYSPGEFAVQLTGYRVCRIHLLGEVNNPGSYFVPANWRVTDAIDMAGGLKSGADAANIEISGYDFSDRADLNSFALFGDLNLNPMVCRGNLITVPPRSNSHREVFVTGAVKNPGRYDITGDITTTARLIEKAGGFTDRAQMDQVTIFRVFPGGLTIDSDGLAVIAGPRRPEKAVELPLLAGDSVYIPYKAGLVLVTGAVLSPGAVIYEAGRDAAYYIERAGGYISAAANRISIFNPATRHKITATGKTEVLDGETIIISAMEKH